MQDTTGDAVLLALLTIEASSFCPRHKYSCLPPVYGENRSRPRTRTTKYKNNGLRPNSRRLYRDRKTRKNVRGYVQQPPHVIAKNKSSRSPTHFFFFFFFLVFFVALLWFWWVARSSYNLVFRHFFVVGRLLIALDLCTRAICATTWTWCIHYAAQRQSVTRLVFSIFRFFFCTKKKLRLAGPKCRCFCVPVRFLRVSPYSLDCRDVVDRVCF